MWIYRFTLHTYLYTHSFCCCLFVVLLFFSKGHQVYKTKVNIDPVSLKRSGELDSLLYNWNNSVFQPKPLSKANANSRHRKNGLSDSLGGRQEIIWNPNQETCISNSISVNIFHQNSLIRTFSAYMNARDNP